MSMKKTFLDNCRGGILFESPGAFAPPPLGKGAFSPSSKYTSPLFQRGWRECAGGFKKTSLEAIQASKVVIKKITACLLALLLALLPFSACGNKTGEGAEFRFPIAVMPTNLDPAIAGGREEALVIANCFEGLLRLRGDRIDSDAASNDSGTWPPSSPAGELPTAGVAERWEVSEDGLRYTFYLRQDTHWKLTRESEKLLGEEAAAAFDTRVTAADFLFAIQRALRPETNAPNAALLFPIQNARAILEGTKPMESLGVETPDDYTLIITLEQPNASFLYALCQSVAMPCNEAWFNATKGRYGLASKYLLCNGPFYLSAWDGANLRLRRSDAYRGAEAVAPSGIVFKLEPIASEQLRLLGAEGGFSAVLLPADQYAGDAGVRTLHNATLALLFRCGGGSPLANAKLRRALCAAVDPAALGFSPPVGLLPKDLRLGEGIYRTLAGPAKGITRDLTKAQALWAEGIAEHEAASGITTLSLTLLCPPEANQQMRQLLQQWQSAFGLRLRVSIESPEPEKLAQRVARGDYDIALSVMEAGSSFAPSVLEQLADGGATGYHSAALDKLLAEAAQTPGQAEAAAALRKAEEHLLQAGVYYPLAPRESVLLLAKGVSGLEVSAAGDVVWFGGGRLRRG